jgi:hypothetical protein
MASRKIIEGSFRAPGGKLYTSESSDEELNELNGLLSPERVESLTEEGMIEGFTGSKKVEDEVAESDPARPQGTEKDNKGEPVNTEPEVKAPWTSKKK